jgi:hypothetical protein
MSTDEFIKLAAIVYLFLGGALTAVFAYSQVRNKNNADAISSLTRSVLDLNERLSEKDSEIAKLKARVAELEIELDSSSARRRQYGRQMGQ